jgi:methylglutamate dehydrogenase subunit D
VSDLSPTRLVPGRSGRTGGPAGLVVRECVGMRSASLIARRGQAQRASDAALAAFGAALPATPRAVTGRGVTFIWTGPAQWLAEAPVAVEDIEAQLASAFGGLVSVTEQSDSRVVLELGGPKVRAVLAKGLPIDLHPQRFASGDVAVTAVAHISVQLRQLTDEPSYRVAVVRSFFGSFWHWLASSAAEYGCEVLPRSPGAGG